MKFRVVPLTAALALALVAAAHGTVRTPAPANPQTTDPIEFVSIDVKITDARIFLSPSSAPRGHYGRFVVRNVGKKIHSFTLGKQTSRGTGAHRGFTLTVKPRRQKILLLYLDYRGKLPYYANVRAGLSNSRATGIFRIF
jgi:hypothetical protein